MNISNPITVDEVITQPQTGDSPNILYPNSPTVLYEPSFCYPSFQPIPQDTQPTLLRDYFAAQALRGLLTNANWDHLDNPETQDKLVRLAYMLADKLLESRLDKLNQAISNITKF